MEIKIPYYEDNTRISNSLIGDFLKYGIRYFKDRMDGKEEGITGKFLEKGTMIHMWLLQKDEFWSTYYVCKSTKPKSVQQAKFCEEYLRSTELLENNKIVEAYDLSYVAYGKTYDAKLTAGEAVYEKTKDYIEDLQNAQGKQMITWADVNELKLIEKNISYHKLASKLLNNEGYECYNEFHINWEDENFNLPLKSLIDRWKINHNTKKVILIDLKTTAKIHSFNESVETFKYYRQIAYYLDAIKWYLNHIGYDASAYTYEAYIIAISTDGKGTIRVFDMLKDVNFGIDYERSQYERALCEIQWHIINNLWDYSRQYYEGNGAETLI